ncbi:crotonase/enoyl-CoA hydratase family protein [Roseicella aquatilis]|uniref:Enoyl-CoA hydratase n=1 Tax=Roseicella aquatilis TaxID=2527868 RepID=A0A4R4DYZ1_9PROT|nr:crotonase/enoyl-CoA hydratase family protein [Roseicella aquatilis]TCZ66616.1 enoyl-CoA hydratase [Roseicella aquatilis]
MTFVRSPLAAGIPHLGGTQPAKASTSPRPASTHETLDTAYDAERGIYWCRLRPTDRPCFSPQLLRDIAAMHAAIPELFAADAPLPPPRWFVCGSAIPGIFNLGGDLGLFRKLIAAGDRAGLVRYGHAAVEAIHRNHTALDLPMITVALVQGDALGGGFECALAHDLIVAERGAKFGLPEVLFNLFPGMGAYSFLSRRLGRAAAEEFILSGTIRTAEELHAMGLVDVLAEDGEGEAALLAHLDRNARFHNARQAMYRARRKVDPVTLHELREVVEVWAEAAMRLSEQDLRRMARLCGAQDRRIAAAA